MSEETTALVPVEERQVEFYGDEITAVLVPTGNDGQQIYVPIRPICNYLGLSWTGQLQRLKRDPVLADEQGVCVIHTPRGGSQEMICLPLELIPGWLFGVSSARVKPELQDKIIRYQRECFRVLWQAFQANTLTVVEKPIQTTPSTGLAQIREMALAIAEMAEQQMELERNVSRAHNRLDQAAQAFKALEQRVGGLEKKLTPASLITEAQATEISQAVKALADFLKSKDATKNHYQAVFSEIYRRYGVSSYKNIRADQYAAVLKFLEDWRKDSK